MSLSHCIFCTVLFVIIATVLIGGGRWLKKRRSALLRAIGKASVVFGVLTVISAIRLLSIVGTQLGIFA